MDVAEMKEQQNIQNQRGPTSDRSQGNTACEDGCGTLSHVVHQS